MTYSQHRAALIEYLKAKVELEDWHGVSDAANDLRVLEAQFEPRLFAVPELTDKQPKA